MSSVDLYGIDLARRSRRLLPMVWLFPDIYGDQAAWLLNPDEAWNGEGEQLTNWAPSKHSVGTTFILIPKILFGFRSLQSPQTFV